MQRKDFACDRILAGGFGNTILYRMVDEYPEHDDVDVIEGKIRIIGSVYSAAVTRGAGTKDASKSDLPEKLYKHLAQSIKEVGAELDNYIALCNSLDRVSEKNILTVVRAHFYLNKKIIESINEWRKHPAEDEKPRQVSARVSFTSKYLHFHAPMAVFILDSIAQGKLKESGKSVQFPEDWEDGLRTPYAMHCFRLFDHIRKHYGDEWTPRSVDQGLLGY